MGHDVVGRASVAGTLLDMHEGFPVLMHFRPPFRSSFTDQPHDEQNKGRVKVPFGRLQGF